MELVCKVKCYFRGRVYVPGEKVSFKDGERVPSHFVEKSKYVPAPEPKGKEIKTFTELTKAAKIKKAANELKTLKDMAEEMPDAFLE